MVPTVIIETGPKCMLATVSSSHCLATKKTTIPDEAKIIPDVDAISTTSCSSKILDSHVCNMVADLENPYKSSPLPVEDACATSTTTVDCSRSTCSGK